MAPTVPLELQLLVIDLAIPPLTRKNLGAVRALMRRVPLVNRVWRSYVYDKIPVVPKLVLHDVQKDQTELEHFKEVVEHAGRVVEHCDLDLRRWDATVVKERALQAVLNRYQTAWVDLPNQICDWPFQHLDSLTRLYIDDHRYEDPPTLAGAVGGRLTSFAMANVDLDQRAYLRFPLVKALVIDNCMGLNASSVFNMFPVVEILGVHATEHADRMLFEGATTYSSTVRHILFSYKDDEFARQSLPNITYPSTLRTLTVRRRPARASPPTIPPPPVDAELGRVREACAKSGTIFTVIEAPEDDSAFDVEAWALSVGG
ncbi:hypothetical protein JCM9279_002740 [Rhodotorula babjevae]